MSVDVSVVVATFRRPGLVSESIRSALAQRGWNLEVIVVDDSPEGSARAEIEALGDPRIAYLKMERPSGGRLALVRNAGWRRATGRYVHFLDDDDLMADGAYTALGGALNANPRAGVAFGSVDPFGDDPTYLRHNQEIFADAARRARRSQRLRSRRFLVANMLFCNPCLTTSACMIRREGVVELGGFDPDISPYEDADFFIRVVRRFGPVFVDRVVLRYRTGHSSLMSNCPPSRGPEAYRIIHRKYRDERGRLEFMALKVMGRVFLR